MPLLLAAADVSPEATCSLEAVPETVAAAEVVPATCCFRTPALVIDAAHVTEAPTRVISTAVAVTVEEAAILPATERPGLFL